MRMATRLLLAALLSHLATVAMAAPQVIWHTEAVRPGQTALAFGEGFDPVATRCAVVSFPEADRTTAPPYAPLAALAATPPESAVIHEAVMVSPRRAGYTLSPRREDDLLYVLWFGRPGDWSRPLLVNRPRLSRCAPQVFGAGATLQLFGQNLGGWPKYNPQKRDFERHCWVRFADSSDRQVAMVPAFAESTYELALELPPAVKPGDYQVRVHSTRGGELGWSDPVALAVREPEVWPAQTVDARDHGVAGDGLKDDTAALQKTLDDCAAAGGGTVRLPTGTFLISATLTIPPGVWLRGAGAPSSRLQFDPTVPFVAGQQKPVVSGRTHFRLTDLTVLSGPAAVRGLVVSNDTGPAQDVLIQRCVFRALVSQDKPWNQGVLLNLPWDMPKYPVLDCEISDCEIEATYALFLSSTRRCRILRNKLLHTGMPLACWSMAECLVEGNYWAPGGYNETSAHGPMLMANTGFFGGVVDNVFRLNTGGHHGPGLGGPRNVGEAFAYDSLANVEPAVFRGTASSSTADTVTVAAGGLAPEALRDMTAFIVSGKGVGQVRVVTGNTTDTVTLSQPWAILPDATSMICITRSFRDNLILRNGFTDAGSCFIWGRGFENVFALNQLKDVGFTGAAGLNWQADDRCNPCFFNEFNENWIASSARRGSGVGVISGNYRDAYASPLPEPIAFGTIIRDNHISDADTALTISLGGADKLRHPGQLVWDTLFEGNDVSRCRAGASICERADGTILRANKLDRVETPLEDKGVGTLVLDQ